RSSPLFPYTTLFRSQTSRGLRIAAWDGNTAFDLLDDAGQVLCRVATPENDHPAPVVVSPDGTRLCVQTDSEQRRVAVFDATSGKDRKSTRLNSSHEW